MVGYGAIDYAVIVAQGQMDDGADGYGIVSVIVGYDHRLFRDATDSHDRDVGLIDDGQTEDSAELAGIGDGEGCAFDVGGHELFVACALTEASDAALEAEEVELVGAFEDGNDESPIEGNGDAGVDVLVVADVVAFERSVDDGELLQRDDGGADEEGHEGEARAIALLESVFKFVAQINDAREVDFEHAVDVSAGAARLDHALGDDLAHIAHGDEVAGDGSRSWCGGAWGGWCGRGCGWSRGAMLDEIENVLLGDAAAGSGAADLGEIDVVLAR